MIANCPVANTIGAICRRTAAPAHRVRYIIASRGLQPIGRAGIAWVYSEEQVEIIRAELKKIDAKQGAAKA